MKQTVILTPLPQSAAGANTLRLSAHVALRLEADGGEGKLSDFSDARNWADTDLSLGVSFNGGKPLAAAVVTEPPRKPALWHALFDDVDPTVEGKPFPPYARLPVLSWPVKSVLDFLESTYSQVATTWAGEHPLVDELLPLFREIGFTEQDEKKADAYLEELRDERGNGKRFNEFESGPTATPPHHFLALKRFYTRPGRIVELAPPKFDFHELLALLAQHPGLLRLLGLVVDLEVSAASIRQLAPSGDVQLVTAWTPLQPTTRVVRPKTRYELNPADGTFAAAPKHSDELKRGHLPLGDGTRYDLVTVDPDGAGLKALNFASSLKRAKLAQTLADDHPPRRLTLPALRSAGLSIVRRERQKLFVPRLDDAVAVNEAVVKTAVDPSQPPPVVHREDVTMGYAIDIWDDKSREWHSIVRRQGAYDFTSVNEHEPIPPDDEAAMVSAPALPADPNADQELYLQQSLFQWMGWSLAVAPPGLAIQKDDTVGPDPAQHAPPPAVPLSFALEVPELSLPRLRYGREYRVRMRAIDVSGGRVPFAAGASPDDPELVATETYYRWEPLPSPVLTLAAIRTEGESVDRLVIRSDYMGPIDEPGARHVVPPKAAVHTVEQHGKLDAGDPSLVDGSAAMYDFIVKREAKTLADVPGALVDHDDAGGDQTIYIPEAFALPYLPDPLVSGATFRRLPGGTSEPDVDSYDFAPTGSDWHALQPIRLEVRQPSAGDGLGPPAAPVFTEADRTLHVELPKAAVVRVPVSSRPVPGALETLGIWHWILAAAKPKDRRRLNRAAEQGAHWMLTPYRILTLVHAVRRPLTTPEFVKPTSKRLLGQTFTTITDRMTFSRKSTGKVDVYGAWDEWSDHGPDAPPSEDPSVPTRVETLAFQVPLERPGEPPPDVEDDELKVEDRHHFGDTKHRVVTYRAVATTRFAEYFVRRIRATVADPPKAIPFTDPKTAVIPESVTVKEATTGKVLTPGRDYVLNPGATTLVPTQIDAGTRLVITFLVPEITRETEGLEKPRTVKVKSSARPAAPKVLYAVPTFRRPDGPPLTQVRQGAGIRVYLDRPWWSSGGGELLGVLLWKPKGTFAFDPPPELQPYVTRWGLDPLFASGSLPARNPTFSHFPLSRPEQQLSSVTLDELPDAVVDVAGHEVGFDRERNLWYCDLDIDAGSAYTPFVRLALARLQPQSLPGAHISRVVLADYIQVAPDRSVTLLPKPAFTRARGRKAYQVTVAGLTYERVGGGSGRGSAHAILEQRDPSRGPAEELGWKPVGDPFPLEPVAAANPISGIWSGIVTLPARKTGPYRLVVEQFEVLPIGKSLIGPGYASDRRLVYSDIVPL